MEIKILHNGIEIDSFSLERETEYIIGRDDSCEIQTLDPKVSRRHAKLFLENDSWSIELLSQTGTMNVNGQSDSNAILEHHDQVQIHSYTLVFINSTSGSESLVDSSENSDVEEEPQELVQEEVHDQNEYIDETTAGGNQEIENYLRIKYKDGSEDLLKIEGNHWVMGRSDSTDVQVKDNKASRKHLIIRFDGKKYYGKDLGSSNGTNLNNKSMEANREYPIQSGDHFQIGGTKIFFEQRNALFEKQLAQIPVQVHKHAMIQMGDQEIHPVGNMPAMINANPGELGFVVPEGFLNSKDKNKKKIFYAAIGAFIIIFAFVFSGDDQGSQKNASKKPVIKSPFESLSVEQQDYVNNAYISSHRFFSLEQWDLAIGELQKVHKYIPTGYSDSSRPEILSSKEMLTIAESAVATLREQEILEEEQKQKELFNIKVVEVLNSCQLKANSMNESQARACLDFVFINQPENPQALAIIESIKDRNQKRKQRAVAAANKQSQIRKGESLYYAAKRVESKGDILDAIAAYDKHIKSHYQDPKSLKSKSRANKSRLRAKISSEIERLRRIMQTHYEAEGQLRDCIQTANKILKLDPKNLEAQDKRALATTQLNTRLREDFQDSIFKEAHGEVEQAKKIWKRIISRDVPQGDYYNKAMIKLKKHGGN